MYYVCTQPNTVYSTHLMNTFITRTSKESKRAAEYFLKMHNELDLEKYKLDKYSELIELASFQNLHDADLAYQNVYATCAKYANTRQGLLNCLEEQINLLTKHPAAFSHDAYKQETFKLITEIKKQLNTGALDYLFD
jgi:hypothetical protein